MLGDRCFFVLRNNGEIVGLAGIHVDDYLIAGKVDDPVFQQAEASLKKAFRWGKWEEKNFEFAGCTIKQADDYSIVLDQENYTNKWISEIVIDKSRARKATLLPAEVSALRAALGTMSWRATQTAPQYLAETSLLLSEISRGTVETLYKVNKLVRDMKAQSKQGLYFPSWGRKASELAVITWADASQHNRPDKSSTVGILTALAPADFLQGDLGRLHDNVLGAMVPKFKQLQSARIRMCTYAFYLLKLLDVK